MAVIYVLTWLIMLFLLFCSSFFFFFKKVLVIAGHVDNCNVSVFSADSSNVVPLLWFVITCMAYVCRFNLWFNYWFSFTLAYSRISHEYSSLFIIVINLIFMFSL